MASTSGTDDTNESSTIDPDDSTISTDDFQTTYSFVEEEESDKSLKEDEDMEKSSISENPAEIKEPENKEVDVDGTSPSDQDTVSAVDPSFAENKLKDILEASDDTSTFAENKLKEILEASNDSEGEQEDTHYGNVPNAKEDEISQGNGEDVNVVEYREDSTTENIDAESSEQDVGEEDSKDVLNVNIDEDNEDSTNQTKDEESSEQDINREDSEDVVNIKVNEEEEDSTTESKDEENTEQDEVSEKSVDADVENRESTGTENNDVKMMAESPSKEQEIGDDDHVKNVDSPTIGNKDVEDLVKVEKKVESNDNLTNDDDETFANEEVCSTVEDVGMMAGDIKKDTESPQLEDTVNDMQKSFEMDDDDDRIDDVTETSANQIIDNTSVDDKITDEHIANNTVENATGGSEDEDNAIEKEATVTENSVSEAQREIEQSIETLEVEDQNAVIDDTESELKEIEKSAESITHPPETAHVTRSHSGSFEASVELLKSDEQQPTEPGPGPEAMEGFEDVELLESNGLTEEAGDMEKYMERKEDEKRVLIESEQRQRTGSD